LSRGAGPSGGQRRREFLETLAEVQEMAAANGLTPEILEEILGDE
jgi:hypothetical protein